MQLQTIRPNIVQAIRAYRVDDLMQAGMMGLLDAVRRYQQQADAQFETYAVTSVAVMLLGVLTFEPREQELASVPIGTDELVLLVPLGYVFMFGKLGLPPQGAVGGLAHRLSPR